MDVSTRIKELLRARNWSVNRLAVEAGLTSSTLYSIMEGTNNPTITTIETLCEALDISLCDFFKQSTINEDEDNVILSMYHNLDSRGKHLVKSILLIINNAE